jgi:hypothetical protein
LQQEETPEETEQDQPESRQLTTTEKKRQAATEADLERYMDYDKFRRDMEPSTDPVQIRKLAFVLQAMRLVSLYTDRIFCEFIFYLKKIM